MNELVIKIMKTSELGERELNSVISLKQQYWAYSTVEQKRWMDENIISDDNHLMIFMGGTDSLLKCYQCRSKH